MRDGFLAGLATASRIAGHEALRTGLEVSLGNAPGENPSDTATLDLLKEIVFHTLQSGHVPEAWDIYQNRIGGGRNLMWRLGAYERGERICRAFAGGASPTVALARVADPHTSHTPARSDPAAGLRVLDPPYKALPENTQAIFINDWALYLLGLGRLEAAARGFELALEIATPPIAESAFSRSSWNRADSRGRSSSTPIPRPDLMSSPCRRCSRRTRPPRRSSRWMKASAVAS